VQDEIQSLADVQRLLLPDNPRIRGLDYAIHYQPAEIAAGDYYDLMIIGDDPAPADVEDVADVWGMMIGDVSGHGPAAAMEAVQFDAILRTYRGDEPPGGPAGALTYANRYYFSRRSRQRYMTVFAALYTPADGTLDYVSAGHPPALLRRGSEVIRLGEDGDIPLGITRGHRFDNSRCRFGPGDMLLAFTDGLIEASDLHGAQFGLERVARILREAPPDPRAVVDALRSALIAHQHSDIGTDDQTIVALHQRR
jgi:sigma-B regulation protein RsbU (phosphoserine phosphatase)